MKFPDADVAAKLARIAWAEWRWFTIYRTIVKSWGGAAFDIPTAASRADAIFLEAEERLEKRLAGLGDLFADAEKKRR